MAADLLLESESAISAARAAARSLADGAPDAKAAISLAAFACADAFSTITATAIQMHGGIAFTWAHPAHLYLRAPAPTPSCSGRRPLTANATCKRWEPEMADGNAATDDALRDEVRAWLAANWKPLPARQPGPGGAGWVVSPEQKAWLEKVVDARWAVPRWPTDWLGRGLPDAQAPHRRAEFAAVGAPGTGQDRSNLWANTALAYATPTFKAKIVPALLKSQVAMCLLYSEPGAGSDSGRHPHPRRPPGRPLRR
ncbi:MAG: acyl-CoA dehydrogenase family protein [Caulobacteraceae bacterium]